MYFQFLLRVTLSELVVPSFTFPTLKLVGLAPAVGSWLGGFLSGANLQLVGGFFFGPIKQALEIPSSLFAVSFQTRGDEHLTYLRKGPPLACGFLLQFFLQACRKPESNLLVLGWHWQLEF